MKKIIITILLATLSFSSINAWNGIIAQNGDIITLSKWNEMVGEINSKLASNSINDLITGTGTLWSSSRIQDEFDLVGLYIIDDTSTSTDTVWSSQKVQNELNTKLNNSILNDAVTAANNIWSSQKTQNEINNIDTSTKVARVRINQQTNLNNSTNYGLISLNNMTINTIGASISSNQVNLPAGTYKFDAEISITSNSTRVNLGIASYVNGVIYSHKHGEGYIRNTSGHNESSISHSDVFVLDSPGNVSFRARRISTSGTVTTQPNLSRIIITKLD